jgi:glutamine synthetase
VSPPACELVALVCCDLGAIVRGRALPAAELDAHLLAGVGWVPANHSLTPLGPLAEPNPFGSVGDLRLLPDLSSRARVPAGAGASPLDMVICDIVETDGRSWECCPRRWLREALDELEREHGLRAMASFEHEFQLADASLAPHGALAKDDAEAGSSAAIANAADAHAPAPPFSLQALRLAEPLPGEIMEALIQAGVEPERIFAEYAPHQFEIPVRTAEGVAAADRSVVLMQVVREIARRRGLRATFTPLLDPEQAGSGVHIHLTLLDARGEPVLYDAARPGCLSELGERFAAGILLHAPALVALTAPSPASSARLAPHRWSAGAVCVGQRNRETLLRLPPLVALGGDEPARQLRLEYRGADATANPYLALGAILRAGMDGVRAELPALPILDRDPATLDPVESERYGVGMLPGSQEEALRAFADDPIARGWMTPLMYDAYTGVRRSELEQTADWEVDRLIERYAAIY